MQKKSIAFFVLSIVLNVQADNHTYQHIQLVTHDKIGVKPLLQKIIAYYDMYFIFKSRGNVNQYLQKWCTHKERFYFYHSPYIKYIQNNRNELKPIGRLNITYLFLTI